jgi:predicted  nucleic acid-binding Zn-ribbon protein
VISALFPLDGNEIEQLNESYNCRPVQTVALDAASRQLEQMIDQARSRHQAHRTKFKDAIDYLDQIFEDLRKECDQLPNELERVCFIDISYISNVSIGFAAT